MLSCRAVSDIMSGANTARAQKQTVMAAIDNRASLDMPLDYSFLNLTEVADIEQEEPRDLNKQKNQRNKDNKFCSRCVKLNNNGLQEVKEIINVFTRMIDQPLAVTWLDLSFNSFTKIDPILCDLQSLQILYFHGNQVDDIKEVDKLGGLPRLTKLSLHGNPIEKSKVLNYRWYVLCQIPQLRNLDMSAVTKADRATAATWNKNTPVRKRRAAKQ